MKQSTRKKSVSKTGAMPMAYPPPHVNLMDGVDFRETAAATRK